MRREILLEINHLEDLGVDGNKVKTEHKGITWEEADWINLSHDRGKLMGSCELVFELNKMRNIS
jgi:hypothetical protein